MRRNLAGTSDLHIFQYFFFLKRTTKLYTKIIFVFATKIWENTTSIFLAIFHNKFTLCHIRITITCRIQLSSTNVFFTRDNWRRLFFVIIYCYPRFFLTTMFLLSLKQIIWKKYGSIFYPHNTKTKLKALIYQIY